MSDDSSATSDLRLGTPAWQRLTKPSPDVRSFDPNPEWASEELKTRFNDFVAGTFFKAMLEAMRNTVHESKLIHGGRAEEIFRAQLDQTFAERMAEQSGASFSDKLFEQFIRQQQGNLEKAPVDGRIDPYQRSASSEAGRRQDRTL